jgi:signal transduction histidine kinase
LRHNVFLAAKEALNNVVKHAKASEVHLQLVLMTAAFELTIEDNGRGFSLSSIPPPSTKRPVRHGLDSVKERVESLGGRFTIDSKPGQGTRVMFTVPVNVAES